VATRHYLRPLRGVPSAARLAAAQALASR
jgi:hypothetical protein